MSAYLADQLRHDDRDHYLLTMFAPVAARDSLQTLYVFNAEVAKIRESVTETMIGRMKLQWWRDVLATIFSGGKPPQGNPLVESLAALISTHKLSRQAFDDLLTARERDLDEEPPQDALDLERYAEGTAAPLNVLALEILGVTDDVTRNAARHVGIAWALTGILRAVLYHARVNRFLLPNDLLSAQSLTAYDVSEKRNAEKVARVIENVAHTARAHLEKARTFRGFDRRGLSVLLAGSLAEQYLNGFAKHDFDIFDPRHALQRPSIAHLMWKAWRNKF